MKISVVTPVYGCAKSLDILYQRLQSTLSTITQEFEIIMVNDASPDDAWEQIKALAKEDARVKGINLSRNFGQHYAITAGLDFAEGEYVVVMDCDLQDQPEEIIKLYNKMQEGYDVVIALRKNRQDSYFKRLRAKIFFKIFDYLAQTDTEPRANTFSICHKNVITYYKKMKEHTRSYTLFLRWLGFNKTYVEVNHSKRSHGDSSYTFSKLLQLSIDYILVYSNKPLKISISFGLAITIISILFGTNIIYDYFFNNIAVDGWASIMVSLFFLFGLLFANLGILGLYIGKIYDETKARPLYVVKEVLNVEEK